MTKKNPNAHAWLEVLYLCFCRYRARSAHDLVKIYLSSKNRPPWVQPWVIRILLHQPDVSALDEALEDRLIKPEFEGRLSSQEVLNMFQSSLKMYDEIIGTEDGTISV